MSLSFDKVDDILTSTATQTLGTAVSLFAWIKPTSVGENNEGIILNHDTTTTPRIEFGLASTARAKFEAFWSVARGAWHSGNSSITLAAWNAVGVTYDFGATTNDPIFYINGAAITATETGTPSGTAGTDNKTVYIGNESGTSNTFDGLIGELAMWKSILTANEMAAVYTTGVNAVPGAFLYHPMDAGGTQELGTGGVAFTVTGAIAGENPPTQPAGRKG